MNRKFIHIILESLKGARKLILFPLFIFLSLSFSDAQDKISFDHILLKNGLSDASVRSIMEDSEGYVWFGTNNGLNRFNGYEIKKYYPGSEKNSLSSNIIFCLYEDSHKNLWVGTWGGGLCRYNREQDNFITYMHNPDDPGSLRHNDVWDILEDRKGNLWVCTQKGLDRFDYETGKFEKHLDDLKLPEETVNLRTKAFSSIVEGPDGSLWIGIWKYGILNYDYEHRKTLRHLIHDPADPGSLSTSEINTLHATDGGDIWIGTNKGALEKLSFRNDTFFLTKYYSGPAGNQISDNRINFILSAPENQLWIGTSNGLNVFDPESKTFEKFMYNAADKSSLSGNTLLSGFSGKNGLVWIGSLERGVNKYDPWRRKFSDYYPAVNNSAEQNKKSTKSIFKDSGGNLWIGTDYGLNRVYDNGRKMISYTHIPEDKSSINIGGVTGIVEKDRNYLWIGTWGGGLHLFNKKTGKFKRFPASQDHLDSLHLSDKNIRIIKKDDEGNLLIGTTFGYLDIFNPEKESFDHILCYDVDSIHGVPIVAIEPDPSGIVWVGLAENGGVIKFNRKTGEANRFCYSINGRNTLSNNDVLSMLNDGDKIWIGTKNGLNLIDKKSGKTTIYNEKDGLPDKSVLSIEKDADQNLWVSTNLGLSKLNYIDGKIYNYDVNDGVLTNCQTSFNNNDSIYFFGGIEGVFSFSPSKIRHNPYAPPVVLTGFKIFNNPVLPGEKDSPIDKVINETSFLKLNHHQNSFSFDFAALNYTLPQKNKYQYMLRGFDDDWVDAETRRTAYYTNVNAGDYEFLVRGSNNDGLWNPLPVKIKIKVLPPPWKTWWAYSLYVLFFTASVYIMRHFIVSREKLKAQLVMEKMEHERIQQMSKQKDELHRMKLRFFTNVSHEFRTPLTLITGPLEKLLKQAKGTEMENSLVMIRRNARSLLRLINQLLDMSKIESGFMKPSVSKGDIRFFIHSVVSAFNLRAEKLQIDYRFHSPKSPAICWFDEDKLEKILYNLLSNAFKFTPNEGTIIVDLQAKYIHGMITEVELSVKDTGPGIPESERSKIFDYFYRTPGAVSVTGSGIGLSLVFQLVKILRGEIACHENPEGKGSCFTLKLPVKKEAFKIEEISNRSKNSDRITEDSLFIESPMDIQVKKNAPPVDRENKYLPFVLIVDDNKDIRKYLTQNLDDKYKVSEAENGLEAYEVAKESMPDLIISDVMMPFCDGFELCRKIKNDEKTSHIPIILLTAKSGMDNRIEGTETGADDYIEKPFDLVYLRAKTENLLLSRRKLRESYSKKFDVNPAEITSNSRDAKFLENVMNLIEKNIENPDFNVDNMVQEIGMSRAQLYRKLKSLTNQSANDFIRDIRLNTAGKLLISSDQSVAEICYRVGFKDPSYFTKCFRKKFNCVPSEFGKEPVQDNS